VFVCWVQLCEWGGGVPFPHPWAAPQLTGDEDVMESLRAELQRALVQCLDLELRHVSLARDRARDRDSEAVRLGREVDACTAEATRLRQLLDHANATLAALHRVRLHAPGFDRRCHHRRLRCH
jgi:hypothetical protein